MYSLIFFVGNLFTTCQRADDTGITIRWENKRATALLIPARYVEGVADDSLNQLLTVQLPGTRTAISGQYERTDNGVVFEPLIPFTRGMHYELWLRNKRLTELAIPELEATDRPVLQGIYPATDTLPENLLKVYLHFSRPMREGQSLRYVTLLKNGSDTLSGVFLDLQPELWNAERTTLTLWLDPGRIKRDLRPNQQLGTPLKSENKYQLVVSANWPDTQGATLAETESKTFVTVARDCLSPIPSQWILQKPTAGTLQPLRVAFGEALDYSLLQETFQLIRKDGNKVSGKWETADKEKQILFKPAKFWLPGQYTIRIETRLEDLAGNNLNRPFDRDITRSKPRTTFQSFNELKFRLR